MRPRRGHGRGPATRALRGPRLLLTTVARLAARALRRARVLVAVVALAAAPACVGGLRAGRPLPTTGEVRALWVVRTTMTSPERVRTAVEEAARAGFNTLIVQVRGRGDAFYRSTVEPRSESLAGQPVDFDPLALVIEEAHARGLFVHAWVNTFLVWDTPGLPVDERHLVRARPELLAVPRALAAELAARSPTDSAYVSALLAHAASNSSAVEGLYASPSAPGVREHFLRVVTELAERYPVDGIHLDYVRYPNAEYDYSASTLRAFRDWASSRVPASRALQLDRSAADDPLGWTVSLPEEWSEFRREAVTTLVREVSDRLLDVRPEVTLSAAVFPDGASAASERFQEWTVWMEEGLLDVVAPMAYAPEDATFRAQIGAAVRGVQRRRVWAGIGAWQGTFEGSLSKVGIARELGVGGFSLFSYDWASGEPPDASGRSWLQAFGGRAFAR